MNLKQLKHQMKQPTKKLFSKGNKARKVHFKENPGVIRAPVGFIRLNHLLAVLYSKADILTTRSANPVGGSQKSSD
jgi:hypothetical protein